MLNGHFEGPWWHQLKLSECFQTAGFYSQWCRHLPDLYANMFRCAIIRLRGAKVGHVALKWCLKLDSLRTGDHIFRHRGDTIKYSPKHVKLCRKLVFEPKNMMCYTHIWSAWAIGRYHDRCEIAHTNVWTFVGATVCPDAPARNVFWKAGNDGHPNLLISIKRALLHGHPSLLISIKRALLHGHPSLLISIKRALLHGHPSLLISIKRALLHGHPYLLISIKRALLDGHYQPGPEILYQQNARRAKLPDHREHPVFPFKKFAADLLI